MNRKTRPVTSREYKIMLRAERFSGGESDVLAAAESFRTALARSIAQVACANGDSTPGKFQVLRNSKQATVQFFDTKDRRLRNSSFVFRQRQPIDGGPLELTLKRRHPDRFLVSGSKTGGKTTMEEDIKTTSAHTFLSLYSLSGKVADVPFDTKFQALRDIRAFYRHFGKQLGEYYQGGDRLLRVCDFIAKQTVLEGVLIPFNDEICAKCALILWHESNRDHKAPGVVEFSFRYRDKELGEKKEPFTIEIAKRGYDILQAIRGADSPAAPWINLDGPTKTAFAFSRTRN